MTETKSINFWTDGESFTKLLKSFWEEGRYEAIYKILKDGGLNLIAIKPFFELRSHFEGSTNIGDGTLNYVVKNEINEDFAEKLYWSLRNCAVKNKDLVFKEVFVEAYSDEEDEQKYFYPQELEDFLSKENFEKVPDLQILQKFISREKIIDLCKKRIIEKEQYSFNPSIEKLQDQAISGVILTNGDLITCEYMGHQDLFHFLYKLDLASSSDWTDDDETIHISSGQFSGIIENFNELQIQTLVKYKSIIKGEYSGFNTSTLKAIFERNSSVEDHGGKYNNLTFLKKYYPEIKLPKFSKEYEEGLTCLRTSPEHSLPGLLTSKFDITKENSESSIKELENDFEKYKDIINTSFIDGTVRSNILHYFFQEKIEGLNGVCNIIDKEFSYSLSRNQGDIVAGKKGNETLSNTQLKKLKNISFELYNDLKIPIQLEFVITESNEIYIVQLRELKNNFDNTVIFSIPENVIVEGKTFSKGIIDCKLNEILIVDEDAKPEELLGKKALIVKSDTQFSHILALSKALEIPSIYATGELPKLNDTIKLVSLNKKGFICTVK